MRGSPCMCIRQHAASRAATIAAIWGSARKAVTSLTSRAPACSAACATAAFEVSIEIRAAGFRASRPSMTGSTRSCSTAAGTGWAPGRVDSPPTSSRSAPSASSRSPWVMAASGCR